MPSAVGGIVGGLFGGSTPSSPTVTTFQPSGTAAFDQQYQNLTNQVGASNPYAALAPQANATFNAAYSNPYAPEYQASANTAGGSYGTQGATDIANAGALTDAGNTALTGANQVLQQGFDPQSALYQRTLQQLNDQVGANSASRGITNSPYGASVANSADSNFNIDWQAQQLQNQLAALTGYTSGVTGANSDFSGSSTLGNAGAGEQAKAGAVPFAASTDITNSQSDAMNQLLSVLGNYGSGQYNQNTLTDLMSYLQLGAGQSNTQANLDLQNYQNALKASQASQSGLGGLVSGGLNALGTTVAANPSSVTDVLSLLAA